MKHRVIFATGNQDKLREIREILGDIGVEICSMKEAGFEGDIVENGTTFAENAEIKARAVWEQTGGIVLADDSGLVIDFLGGEPGVYSARYMEGHPYSERNAALIERVKEAKGEERSARFVCNIAAVLPDGTTEHAEAVYEGMIAEQPAGENGFGYDPILYLPEYGKTSAELSEEEKNAISHRGKALRAMREILKNRLEEFRL
jgi:XTP/dITP diphosphohydrolase